MTRDEAWLLKEKYNGIPSTAFAADVERLKQGEPLAYLIGQIPFLNTVIWLDSRPLIPRPETEHWVHHCHKIIATKSLVKFTALDMCAGSGAIGVATLYQFPYSLVDFVEIDPTHLPTIEKNCTENQIGHDRYQLYQGDLFGAIPSGRRYDFILSNPPYIDESLHRTDQLVIAHEPRQALFSKRAGTAHLTQIINLAPDYLAKGGELWLEHEPEHSQYITTIATHRFAVTTYTDQYGLERYSRLVLQ